MTVAFNNMSATERTSLFFAEFNAGVSPNTGISTQVLIGHKLSTGTAAAGVLAPLGGTDPNTLFGVGSILADMAQFARYHDPVGAVYVLPVAEPMNAVARVDTVTFTAATSAGTFVRYLNGERISFPIAAGNTAAAIAARFAAAVNAGYVRFNKRMNWTMTATVSAAVVTLTSNHGGTVSNQFRLDAALDGDEVEVAGVTATLANVTAGAGDVDLAVALAFINTIPAIWVTSAFPATIAQLGAADSYLSDSGTGAWSPSVQRLGHYTTSLSGSLAALTVFGTARNGAHVTVLGVLNFPHPSWCINAALNGVIARSKNIGATISEAVEISRPLQTLPLQGIRPPKVDTDRWDQADRNSLYNNGIAGYTVDAANVVRLERIITTYQRNAWGSSDTTFLDVETLAQSMYVGRYLRQRIESTYPRCVLMDDNPRGVQGVVTPAAAKATVLHAYIELCNGAICEQPDLIAKYLIVERSSDANRLDCFLPIDVANQLRVFAANVTIYQQFDADVQVA